MKRKINNLTNVSLLLCLLVFAACKDIIKNDLSNTQLQIQTPPDNFRTNNFSLTFVWDQLKDAEYYHLQIATPRFDSMQQLLLDTLVSNTNYTFTLNPGKYQWRIRAENSGSSTSYITRTIFVDTNSNLNGQTFNVSSPVNNYLTNSSIVTFNWPNFYAANQYEFVLLDANNNVIRDLNTANISIADTLYEGSFTWKVRAINTGNGSATQFSDTRTLIIDQTPPAVSIPLSPANNSIDTNSVTLTWTRPIDVYGDSLIVASDSLFTSIQTNIFTTGTASFLLPPLPLNQKTFWRIRSRDLAGNWSSYSTVFTFTVVR